MRVVAELLPASDDGEIARTRNGSPWVRSAFAGVIFLHQGKLATTDEGCFCKRFGESKKRSAPYVSTTTLDSGTVECYRYRT